ncbi:MAG: glycosyltransferase [bacterium]|nr:glycosyltransferase [bacterium]
MKLLLLYDVRGWAWYFKSKALQKHLKKDFDKIDIMSSKNIKNNKWVFKKYHHISWMGWLEGKRWARQYKGVSAGISSHNYYYKHFGMACLRLPKYDALTCVSRILYDEVKKWKLNKNIYLCQNGVDEEMFQPYPIKHDKFVVGWMGQPTEGRLSKGAGSIDMHGYQHVLKPLVESFRGNKRIEFKIMAKTFKNAIPHKDMVKWYNGLDLFIHTGLGTGTPNPLFEAMACGVPCISTAIGAAPEVITHEKLDIGGCLIKNGFLVGRYHNKEEALKVTHDFGLLIKSAEQQREVYKKLGVNARQTIEQSWTWKQRSKAWAKVFKKHGKKL